MNKSFYFAQIANTETQTFDNSLEHFHSVGISGTIRENIQNSIDARLVDNDDPVEITIVLDKINKSELPGIEEIEQRIHALEGGNSYTQETIEHMKKALESTEVPVLTFEDSNTKGLSGADALDENTTYKVFAYKKGVHHQESDNDLEITRGGSHGVGKIANNAASDIHLMYFANCDEAGNEHLGGTVHLIEHRLLNESYRSTGYFAKMDEKKQYVPFENKYYHPLFHKKTRGLKLIIPFLKSNQVSTPELVRSVCDNFFIALLTNKLKVSIRNKQEEVIINHKTIKDIVFDVKYYPENMTNIETIKKNFTPLYLDTYLNHLPSKLTVESNTDSYTFDLYFKYNEEIKTGRVGIVRSMGMKIVDHKVKGYVRRSFNAILIGGAKEDQYLKTLENESHTELSDGALRDKLMKRDARKFLNNLNREIGKIIDEEWEKLYPSEGKIDTSDLLYERKVTFRTKLESMSEKIELANGKKIRKKKVKERRKPRGEEGRSTKPSDREKVRKPRKLKVSSEDDFISDKIIVPTEVVNRVVFPSYEVIYFDLKTIKELSPNGRVNISFRVVDGEGREYDNELDKQESYAMIKDVDRDTSYDFDSFTLYNVEVKNNQIKLHLTKKDQRSSSLKFLYKLEVLQ